MLSALPPAQAQEEPTEAGVQLGKDWRIVRDALDTVYNELQKANNLRASETCDDETFLRRAFLDLLGVPPAPEDIEKFRPGKADYKRRRGQEKREGLIAELLTRPECADNFAEYMRVQLHAIAAGVGLTYELLTGDLSQVNYSSIRAGLIEFRRRMEALQWQLLVPGLCRPVWQRFVETAQAAGLLPPGAIEAEWTAPRFEAVDPLKDVQAAATKAFLDRGDR